MQRFALRAPRNLARQAQAGSSRNASSFAKAAVAPVLRTAAPAMTGAAARPSLARMAVAAKAPAQGV